MVLRGNWGGIEPRRGVASREYVSTSPSITKPEVIPSKPHIRDELVKFGDPLIQATGRAREMLEVMSDDL